MIVIRNIFQIRAGVMKQAVASAKQGQAFVAKSGFARSRLLTDVVGDFYTLVLETECASLQEFESGLGQSFGSDEWQTWYRDFTQYIQSGRREIMNIVE